MVGATIPFIAVSLATLKAYWRGMIKPSIRRLIGGGKNGKKDP